jgi:hypothetical protein
MYMMVNIAGNQDWKIPIHKKHILIERSKSHSRSAFFRMLSFKAPVKRTNL